MALGKETVTAGMHRVGVVIPAAIRRRLGIAPGSKLDFELEGDSIRVRLRNSIPPSRAEDGYGLLRCDLPRETAADRFRRRGGHAESG